MAFRISGVLGVVFPVSVGAEEAVVGTAREQLSEIVLFLPDIVDLKDVSGLEKSKQSFVTEKPKPGQQLVVV